jgi:hypothetical protein
MTCVMVAMEDRLRAGLLIAAGFHLQKCLPEADEFNFAPRVKVPVLMLNGRYDIFSRDRSPRSRSSHDHAVGNRDSASALPFMIRAKSVYGKSAIIVVVTNI